MRKPEVVAPLLVSPLPLSIVRYLMHLSTVLSSYTEKSSGPQLAAAVSVQESSFHQFSLLQGPTLLHEMQRELTLPMDTSPAALAYRSTISPLPTRLKFENLRARAKQSRTICAFLIKSFKY